MQRSSNRVTVSSRVFTCLPDRNFTISVHPCLTLAEYLLTACSLSVNTHECGGVLGRFRDTNFNISLHCSSYFVKLITVRNEVAEVMFLHLSVSHSVHGGRGGCLLQCMLAYHTTTPPPGSRRLLLRTVRIIPECILVLKYILNVIFKSFSTTYSTWNFIPFEYMCQGLWRECTLMQVLF